MKKITLSPSRVKDFLQCPLMYKFKTIDLLPSPPSIEAIRGTHVHLVLEKLYNLDASKRSLETALELVTSAFAEVVDGIKSEDALTMLEETLDDAQKKEEYYKQINTCISNYFKLENPKVYEPVGLETWIKTTLECRDSGEMVEVGGIIDRLEVARTGEVRISDYKTGSMPDLRFQDDALFQMLFYALVYAKEHGGKLPRTVKLLYLKDANVIEREPTVQDLQQTEEVILSVYAQIQENMQSKSWEPKSSPLCAWCAFQINCPLYAGELSTPDPEPH
ncbi:MAG: PD-(D/E)XK nuclease family protein [Candidatus Ancillula trichonymphae]|jgi:putative RecB family exonuclease|nr:PD-(D/E)XK nuclease family protein [Candidatus Ancillula trichonymphae]